MNELKIEFYKKVVPTVRMRIRELIHETDREFRIDAELRHYKNKLLDMVTDLLISVKDYKKYSKKGRQIEMYLIACNIEDLIDRISKLQRKIISLRKAKDGKDEIYDMIQRAREYPIDQLLDFDRCGMALCPFHADTEPSLKHYPDSNTAYCFSCCRRYDSIDIVRQIEGISFIEAVRRLQ